MSDIEDYNEEEYNAQEEVEEEQLDVQDEEEDIVQQDIEDEDDDEDDDEDEENNDNLENKNLLYDETDDEEELSNEIDEDSDDEDSISFDYHIDNEFKTNFIQSIHPEEFHEPIDKILALTKIIRSETTNLIDDPYHTTYPFLTKYEKTRILGIRISQLNEGAKPFVDIHHKIIDNHIIAEKELKEKVLPFIIMRPLPNGKKEYWRLEDLEIIER